MRRATIAIAAALALPSAAHAQYAPFPEDPPPGVTITGAGLARAGAKPLAARRAIRDARRRGAAIARAAGVRLGGITSVEAQDSFPQFGRPARPRRRPLVGAVATVTFAIVDGGLGGNGVGEVAAYGDARARIDPPNRRSNRSIRRTLLAGRAAVTPRAAAAAARNARRAARAAGLELGALVSISQPAEPYFYDPALGSFGPGQFCGVVRGRGGERRRRCFRHRWYSLTLEATYEAR
jgi:hypothetical protein